MTDDTQCPVCGHSALSDCDRCGAEIAKVRTLLLSAQRVRVPSLWQILWKHDAITFPLSEAVWDGLTPEFQNTVLHDYRRLSCQSRRVTSFVMFLLTVTLLGLGFCGGVSFVRWFGIGAGRAVEWLCGIGGLLLSLPLRVIPVGTYIEDYLLRNHESPAANAFLRRFALIGHSIIRRSPLPWYENPDVLFPGAVAVVIASGWMLL
jgi:hypothetical protein